MDACNFLSSPLQAMALKDISWATVHIDLFVLFRKIGEEKFRYFAIKKAWNS